jgi:hypothetical protein
VVETISSARLADRSDRVVIPLTIRSAFQPVPGVARTEGRWKEWAHLNPRIFLFPDRSQIV